MARGHQITNFGGNVSWRPKAFFRPLTEERLLELMEQHRGVPLRAVASLHSWSPVAATDGVTLDLKDFCSVKLAPEKGSVWLGAGCTLQHALDRLRRDGLTLPTLGAIKRQTIAGAISTGTHGSGSPGLSHFVQAVRVARYCRETGKPVVETVEDGEELRAVRCGLGCLGILVEIRLPVRPLYLVEETLRVEPSLDALLERFSDYPLSFFTLAPYTDALVLWQRREVSQARVNTIKAFLYRQHNFWGVDVAFHLLVSLVKLLPLRAIKLFFSLFPKLLLLNKPVVDDSEHQLTLAHDLFRHEEMELFIPEAHIRWALPFLGEIVKLFAGDTGRIDPEIEKRLRETSLLPALAAASGSYNHHYPLTVRRIHPEDTLISMASGDEVWYSISLFTYRSDRESYYRFCEWTARACVVLFGARLHWGKYFPLDGAEIAPSYPHLEKFRNLCREKDPDGMFLNDYTRRVLGL